MYDHTCLLQMPGTLYISGTHPLSRFHVYDQPIKIRDVKVFSLEAAFWFLMISQYPRLSDAGDILLMSKVLQREPTTIRRFVKDRRDYQQSADWLLQTYNVWYDILLDQVNQRAAFYRILREQMSAYDNPLDVNIIACSANKNEDDYVYSSAWKESLCKRLCRNKLLYPGANLWGQLIKDIVQVVFGAASSHELFGISALLNGAINISPSRPKSLLLLSDSQLRPISNIALGENHAISGGTFNSIANFGRRFKLEDYHLVIIFAGINDCQRDPGTQQYALESLYRFLCYENARYLRSGKVVVCPIFYTPKIPSTEGYADWVVQKFANTPVTVVPWSDGNPFVDGSGRLVPGLFEPVENFHLLQAGIRHVVHEIMKHLPAFRQIPFVINELPYVDTTPSTSGVQSTSTVRSTVVVNTGSRKSKIDIN